MTGSHLPERDPRGAMRGVHGTSSAITVGMNDWYHVSSHGAVLFCIAADPDCTINDLAEMMCLTHRTVWGIIGDLRRAGTLGIRKDGRRHHYTVNLDGPFLHPSLRGYTLRPILGQIVKHANSRVPVARRSRRRSAGPSAKT